jgi:hypothetical protein
MAHNQWFVVPRQLSGHLRAYLFKRQSEMRKIEQQDLEQLSHAPEQ